MPDLINLTTSEAVLSLCHRVQLSPRPNDESKWQNRCYQISNNEKNNFNTNLRGLLPGSPFWPSWPNWPGSPGYPRGPISPLVPGRPNPGSPLGPGGPDGPGFPVCPFDPVTPTSPCNNHRSYFWWLITENINIISTKFIAFSKNLQWFFCI